MSDIWDRWREEHAENWKIKMEDEMPPNTNTREYKKEQLIQALIKELGTSRGKPKRIRKVVNKFY